MNEHVAFLNFVAEQEGEPFDFLDLANVPVTVTMRDGRQRTQLALTLGMLTAKVICSEQLWERGSPPSSEEKISWGETWARLQSENAPLRLIGSERITSAPISAFDDALFAQTTEEWTPAIRVIGHVLGWGIEEDYFQVGDTFLGGRVAELIRTGRLETRRGGPGRVRERYFGLQGLHRDAEVRRVNPSSR